MRSLLPALALLDPMPYEAQRDLARAPAPQPIPPPKARKPRARKVKATPAE